jgi:Carboxypeptidase regulatory-like domain
MDSPGCRDPPATGPARPAAVGLVLLLVVGLPTGVGLSLHVGTPPAPAARAAGGAVGPSAYGPRSVLGIGAMPGVDVGRLANPTALALADHAPPPTASAAGADPASPAAARSPPLGPAVPGSYNGSVTGVVLDSITQAPVPEALVTVSSLMGTLCSVCAPVYTNASGGFVAAAPVGSVEVSFGCDDYLGNETWTSVANGSQTSVGTLYLVHDGWAIGTVASMVPGHPGIGGVQVSAVSRDASITIPLAGASLTNGSFRAAVPPLPSQVTFTAPSTPSGPSPFLSNWTYTNTTPYGVADLGVVYLDGGVSVHAEFVDATNGTVLPSTVPTTLAFCPDIEPTCLDPIQNQTGGASVAAWGVAGSATVHALAIGYVENDTSIPDVPNSNGSVDLGTIYLTPAAGVEVTINLTGGTPAPGGWANGTSYAAYVCSLDGIEVATWSGANQVGPAKCLVRELLPLNSTVVLAAAPLRDVLVLIGFGSGFPVAQYDPPYLPPPYPGAEVNHTWINATPGRILDLGSLDVTPGTLISGTVAIDGGTTNLSGQVAVEACSTDEPSVCGIGVPAGARPTGCPTASNSFCVPAPPGPVELTVTASSPVTGLTATNRTWVSLPYGCCAQDGHPTPVGQINLSLTGGLGWLTGQVLAVPADGPPAPLLNAFAVVRVCPAGPPPAGAASGCTEGVSDPTTATFGLAAPDGWDGVTVAGPDLVSNSTWVFVSGNNTTGAIELADDATITGRVVDPTGHGLYEATVSWCPVGEPDLCSGTGGVLTNTAGNFSLSVPGGPLPWGTYEVHANASGYAETWTWVNTSSRSLESVGAVALSPIGSAARARPVPAGTNASAWVTGRFIDARTGLGVSPLSISACPVSGSACVGVTPLVPPGGSVNFSLTTGPVDLLVTAPDYSNASVFVNVTAPAVDVGTVRLDPFAWVRGRLAIGPWGSLEAVDGLGANGAFVQACDATQTRCGVPARAGTDGSFNVSAPFGDPIQLTILGAGDSVYGSVFGGYAPLTLAIGVAENYTELPSATGPPLNLSINTEVAGNFRDGSTWDPSSSVARRGAGFSTVEAWTSGATVVYDTTWTNGGGDVMLGLTPAGSSVLVQGEGEAFLNAKVTLTGAFPAGGTERLDPIVLTHWGWVTATIVDAGSDAGLRGATATVARGDPVNRTTLTVDGPAGQDGRLNVTAPPGTSVSVTFFAPGYANRTLTVPVSPDTTYAFGVVSLESTNASDPAWVSSRVVSSFGEPPTPGIVDGHSGAPLPSVHIDPFSPSGIPSTEVVTNALGQFLVNPPVGNPDLVEFNLPDYVPLLTWYNVTAGAHIVVPRLNLTGDGVLAGRVVVEPGGSGAADLEVEACPVNGAACPSVAYTNRTGGFWIAVPPGATILHVVTEAYDANVSAGATAATDTWSWVGTIPVYALAEVDGTVRELPDGRPVPNATVSVCSDTAGPVRACGASEPAGPVGQFSIPYPPGLFLLVVSAPYHNTTTVPLDLPAGAVVAVGTIFLLRWGSVIGKVTSAVGGGGVGNATVQACAAWTEADCSFIATTAADGTYLLLAPPGPVDLLASAPGYVDALVPETVEPGTTIYPGPIALVPLAPEVVEQLSGRVVGGPDATPLAGAFVSLDQDGRSVTGATSSPTGAFTMEAYWGEYVLETRAPGYLDQSAPLTLHANRTGVVVTLERYEYPVSGRVVDGRTGTAVASVHIEYNGSSLAVTDALGNFTIGLPNGTYALEASPPPGAPELALGFSVTVAGGPTTYDLRLPPAPQSIAGSVVDAGSGLPLAHASVTVVGPNGIPFNATAGADGTFRVQVEPGRYTVTALAPGHLEVDATVTVTNATVPLTLALPRTPAASPPVSPVLELVYLVAAAAVVAGGGAAGIRWRRRRSPPPDRSLEPSADGASDPRGD